MQRPDTPAPRPTGRMLWALAAITALAWAAAAWWLAGWLPERELAAATADVADGPRIARGVETLCRRGDEGRAALARLWSDEDDPLRRDLIARAMLAFDCLDTLPDDARAAFELRHAAWRLERLAEDPAEARTRLVEVLLEARDPVSRQRAAERLVATGLDGLEPEARAQLLEVASAQRETAWALELLDALDDEAATAVLLGWLQAAELTPDTVPPARLQRLRRLAQRHWTQLPAPAREAWVADWLHAGWVLRKNASVTQAQPVMVDALWAPPELHGPLAGALAWVRPVELLVDGEPAALDGKPVAAHLGSHLFEHPGAWQRSVDITPLIDKHGRWELGGRVEVALLPAEARGQTLTDETGQLLSEWRERALYLGERVVEPFVYRVYLNPELGLPARNQDDALRKQVVARVDVTLELEAPDGALQVVALHAAGKRVETGRTGLRASHGLRARLVLRASDDPGIDLALRVQARTKAMPPDAWHDLGQAVVRRAELWPAMHPARLDLDLGPVCPEPGPCRIALRVRDSLVVGRGDPRVESYWGHVLDLGVLELELDNAAAGYQWRDLQRRLRR